MSDSQTPENGSAETDDDAERPPRYEQVMRWVEYINEHPPEVWGPQQNAVVNGQIESARAVEMSAENTKRIREFADAELRRDGEKDVDEADGSRTE